MFDQNPSLSPIAGPPDARASTAPAKERPDGPTRVTFSSGDEECVGYLRLPSSAQAPVPCVVLATGFGGTMDTPSLLAAADAFVEAGFAALRFDYRHFGESGGRPRQLIVIEEQLGDIAAAVGFARSHPGIDPARVALWGASLGGGHVVVAASRDPQIAAVVAQSPFNGFPKKVEGRSTASTLRLLGATTWDAVRGMLGLPPAYIPAVGNPGELAVMATPEALATIQGMTSEHWRNEAAPRALFAMMRYRPGDAAPNVGMPLLVCVAANDREGPPDLARALARRARRGEVRDYPVAHFDFYRPEVRARVLEDQVAFLRAHLDGTDPAAS